MIGWPTSAGISHVATKSVILVNPDISATYHGCIIDIICCISNHAKLCTYPSLQSVKDLMLNNPDLNRQGLKLSRSWCNVVSIMSPVEKFRFAWLPSYGEHTMRPNASGEHFALLDALFSCFKGSGSTLGIVFSIESESINDNPPSIPIPKIIATIPINMIERFMSLND